ncbi:MULTISPECIES: Imm7 family immunity protein [unclassified Gilliamella]|uniref:Imm7 family immunity protein n=1 Tax=unclassified Gilliamella TaxID=2685620 RepID=UPI00226A2DF0|nr:MULTISPECIES: Imm7 family immunity protein [unclassified Gilliamella]MCX8583315.1 hypothetical protein [Gilliamella sp. B3372]MCX8595709.1 hypothetical protein [Gilliamella sp. B3367]
MVEYYGWINLRDSTYESDDKEMNIVLSKLYSYISQYKLNDTSGLVNLHKVNGSYQLLVTGNTNHLSQDIIDIFNLYEFIAEIAKGSYGLLYIRNDESEDAFNEFEVFVLARGKIKKEKDPFLSPCIPVIEDDEE